MAMELNGLGLGCFLFPLVPLLLILLQPQHSLGLESSPSDLGSAPLSPVDMGMDDPDTKTNCDELVLVDAHDYPYPSKYFENWADKLKCSPNETLRHCTFTFRGRSDFIRETHEVCSSTRSLFDIRRIVKVNITVSSSEERHEYINWGSHRYHDEKIFCAPPNEDLQVTYESDDNFCSPDFDHSFLGRLDITPWPNDPNILQLVRANTCYADLSRYLHSSEGTIMSSYEPEWSDKLRFCLGVLVTDVNTEKMCFNFTHFRAYPGGAWLQIKSDKNSLIFGYSNRTTAKSGEFCIPVSEGDNVYVKVKPGKDPQSKFHHAFLVHFRTIAIMDEKWHDDDDDGDDLASYWWLFILLAPILFCISCCAYCHCKKKRAATKHDVPAPLCDDDAKAQSLRPLSAVPGKDVNKSTEGIGMTVTESSVPLAEKTMSNQHPGQEPEALPLYEKE